jgi:hypothetical protein
MEIKTKFNPAGILMDVTGAHVGIIKAITITVREGTSAPIIQYTVIGNGATAVIEESKAIGLYTMDFLKEVREKEKAVEKVTPIAPIVHAAPVPATMEAISDLAG